MSVKPELFAWAKSVCECLRDEQKGSMSEKQQRVLIILGMVVGLLSGLWYYNTKTRRTEVPATPVALVAEQTKDYKLLVGANPSVGRSQTFSPPTNSVAITNKAQLLLLIEQSRVHRTNSSQ